MAEYRCGLVVERADDLWHWHPNCGSFPRNGYEIRNDRPASEHLCDRCAGCEADEKAHGAL